MRTLGHRTERPISFSASSELFIEGVRFNDEIQRLPTGMTSGIRKGVFFFKTHHDANQHQLNCIAENMARAVRGRD